MKLTRLEAALAVDEEGWGAGWISFSTGFFFLFGAAELFLSGISDQVGSWNVSPPKDGPLPSMGKKFLNSASKSGASLKRDWTWW